MNLRRIFIKNFRSLRCVEINVRQNPLVILGENNVGKSNVLLALRLLLGRDAQRLRLDLSEEDINRDARQNDELFFSVGLEIGGLQKHPDVEACFKERIDTDGDDHFVRIEGLYEKNAAGEYEWESFLLPPKNRFNDRMPFRRRMYEAIPLFFMDAIRDGEREIRASGTSLLSQLLRDVKYDDVEEDVRKGLQAANAALNRSDEIHNLSSDLTQQLGSLVLGGQAELNIAVANEDLSLLAESLRINIRKRLNEPLTALARQGTGLQNLILISLFRHLMQKIQTDKWRKTPILAIEEPESHLYPHSQRRLFKDLCELNIPSIVTTHSPALVKYADPASLVILRSDSPDQASAYQLSSTYQTESKKQLSQLMRSDGAEVFFSRVIIAVEGDSERIVLPLFAEQMGCDLDRDGVSILNVGSTTSFEPILRAFSDSELSVKCVVLYDQDVLRTDPKLVKQAFDLGLVPEADFQAIRKDRQNVFQERVSLLNNRIGWFGANENFEEEAWNVGYSSVMLQVLKNTGEESNWKHFLASKNLQSDGKSFFEFVSSKRKKYLKIVTAHAVADATQTINEVPDCYSSAIRHATLLSIGGLYVDNNFERRACMVGFKSVILNILEDEGLTADFRAFAHERPGISESQLLQAYFLNSTDVREVRDKARLAVAEAVNAVGCADFADAIRKASFPMREL